jgi:hypothetical protein
LQENVMANLTLGSATTAPQSMPNLSSTAFGGPSILDAVSRREQMLAIANDPASTAVQRGQALAEADRLANIMQTNSGVSPTLSDLTSVSPTLLASTASPKPKPVSWESRRADLVTQLRTESLLQTAGSPDYARDLGRSADNIQYGAITLPSGTYQSVEPRRAIITNPPRGSDDNPLRIDTISAQNSRATLATIDGNIAARNAQIAELKASNRSLAEQNRTTMDPDLIRANATLIAANSTRIKLLEGQNTISGMERNKVINDARLQSSKDQNGDMYRAIASGVDPKRTSVIFINGVNTDVNRSAAQAMELSRTLNVPIDHVVNVSSMDKLVRAGAGIAGDTALWRSTDPNVTDQRIQQHLTGNREAAATAANAILSQLDSGTGKVKVIGYSQGGAIATESFKMVNDVLRARGLNEAQRAQTLGRIEFLGIGPAAAERHVSQEYQRGFLSGSVRTIPELRSVNYRSISDVNDPIANLMNGATANGRSTTGADLGRSAAAVSQMTNPRGILPHLSYFKSYEATDPGSRFNTAMPRALNEWYQGTGAQNVILRGPNTGQ